jgi:hypothetical protein
MNSTAKRHFFSHVTGDVVMTIALIDYLTNSAEVEGWMRYRSETVSFHLKTQSYS